MSYKCYECGHIFDEGEQKTFEELCGEYCGRNCYKTLEGCPMCLGAFEKTVPCEICESEHLDEELIAGVCKECIDKYRKDFNACYKISVGDTKEIKINALLATLFDASDIEQILKDHIEKRWKDVDCSSYIDEDISYFAEKVVEEMDKNENCKK